MEMRIYYVIFAYIKIRVFESIDYIIPIKECNSRSVYSGKEYINFKIRY